EAGDGAVVLAGLDGRSPVRVVGVAEHGWSSSRLCSHCKRAAGVCQGKKEKGRGKKLWGTKQAARGRLGGGWSQDWMCLRASRVRERFLVDTGTMVPSASWTPSPVRRTDQPRLT